jgi:predicted solute-binding protein
MTARWIAKKSNMAIRDIPTIWSTKCKIEVCFGCCKGSLRQSYLRDKCGSTESHSADQQKVGESLSKRLTIHVHWWREYYQNLTVYYHELFSKELFSYGIQSSDEIEKIKILWIWLVFCIVPFWYNGNE